LDCLSVPRRKRTAPGLFSVVSRSPASLKDHARLNRHGRPVVAIGGNRATQDHSAVSARVALRACRVSATRAVRSLESRLLAPGAQFRSRQACELTDSPFTESISYSIRRDYPIKAASCPRSQRLRHAGGSLLVQTLNECIQKPAEQLRPQFLNIDQILMQSEGDDVSRLYKGPAGGVHPDRWKSRSSRPLVGARIAIPGVGDHRAGSAAVFDRVCAA
jgi:hypothetical protein